ncbi:serine/threonine protein kinase [Amycolatopsis mediterranei S699]|uniref:Serine/threonine protein kinase n=2 Tax=Amycolatopsis mediterranei TaxID=33910 RepID=A0A0H3CW47_AMYMU|nr:class III lanthionine synthetase LanKC [Amycolatopsis mediterranei]ADJ42159.1 serine/threonine protein kinase [Amycolatopsis mediterranei U32]AEK38834.1 serine/threonine protein kinase [Amycolatopsis mediterranei S699]AFO73867.1 serine/threonine protein kinase [Amycolatopsis mediterranei S699]AGT80996.1 serine/threonine protein kinase [Amycolatopsis mediterranei RB]KDO07483.1 serine/threonine protein kinase [Amycolatopsis mediterranei]
MDLRYEAFCFADPLFYDELQENGAPVEDFTPALPASVAGWVTTDRGVWRARHPDGRVLPAQGWQVHVSAGLGNASRVLAQVSESCTEHAVAHKHLRSPLTLLARNSKYASGDSEVELATIYPADDNELERVLMDLSTRLEGEHGPGIPSALQYGDGPLYVRYGGFAEQWVEHDGNRVPAVRKPDGRLVPEKREPTSSMPDWVKLPTCLRSSITARKGGARTQFPYRMVRPLHVSNGGGSYLADPKAGGDQVVLKEARPYAGLDEARIDAVERLRREHEVLGRLAGIPGVPRAVEWFTVSERHYLAAEYLPGIPLAGWLTRNYPLTRRSTTTVDLADYTRRALDIVEGVEKAIGEAHARGIVLGDLHPQNILVDEDHHDRISLTDFGTAFDAESADRPTPGTPGFRAPADRTGFAVDEHALAALRLWLFLPLSPVAELAPAKLRRIADFVERRFPLPEGYADAAVAVLAPREVPVEPTLAHTELDHDKPDWSLVRKQIAEAILASATPSRQDRLFPGDIEQFRVGGACFGVGAAGVLHALNVAGAGRFPEHERWLIEAVRREPPTRPGFYDGSSGIAYVLENFGHHDEAAKLLATSTRLVEQTTDHSLESGLAGIGLTMLHFATVRQDNEFGRQALTTAVRLAEALETAAPPGNSARAGLLAGWAGPALLFIRLFERTGESAWLSFADQALCRDLEECVEADDGSLQVRDGAARTLPYAGVGSAGILLAAEQLARHRPDAEAVDSLPALREACLGEFVAQPGLLNGRCGLAVALAANPGPGQPSRAAAIDRHLAWLAWYAVPYKNGLAFPGNRLLRLSMDVKTGGAGILLSLASLFDGNEVLPFLGGTPIAPATGR